ncbi:hypothetical protein BMH29_08865 [Leucobacter sp. OLDS2]|nr:hypothetical protein BMH29_08865 [Leucobacter sp. OLDS2]
MNAVLLLLLGVRAAIALVVERSWIETAVAILLLLVVNAILVPILALKLRRRIALDFDAGTIGTERTGPMPAAEFVMIVDNARTFPQPAHLVEFCFQRGSVGVEVGAFRQRPEFRARNEALLAFLWTWLPVPQQHRSELAPGPVPGITRAAVGKEETLRLLRLS